MNRSFEIVEYKLGSNANIYTVKFGTQKNSEYERFLENPDFQKCPDFKNIVFMIEEIHDRYSCRDEFFKDEDISNTGKPIERIFVGKGMLRLVCIKWSPNLCILGYGAIKQKGKPSAQDNPEYYQELKNIEYIYDKFNERIENGEIELSCDYKILGNLKF